MSIIGLSAEVRVCTALARETGGIYLESIFTHNHYVKSNNLLVRILLLVILSC